MVSLVHEEIIRILRQDKNKGIHMLFNHNYHALVVYAGHLLKDQHKAEDVVQEFFVRLWEDDYLQKVPASGLISYLFTSVRNACFTVRHQKDVLRHPEDLIAVEIPVEAFYADDERIGRVMHEIEKLPERSRQVIECIMMRGMKYKEAADEMNISVNTVKFLLKEATRRLRTALTASDRQLLFLFFRETNS